MNTDYTYLPDPDDAHHPDPQKTTYPQGISPLNPATFPRAEDDEQTLAHSPEFHDLPDPGPHIEVHERSW